MLCSYVGELDILQEGADQETKMGHLEWVGGTTNDSKPFVFAMLVVAVVRSQDLIVKGQLGNTCIEVMLDSGSSISLIKESLINGYCVNQDPPEGLNPVSAAGEPISVIGKFWHQYKLAIFMLITVLLLFVP